MFGSGRLGPFALLAAILVACQTARPSARSGQHAYPTTPIRVVVDTYHGVAVPDAYRWLEDIESSETLAWVQEQNDLTQRTFEGIEERQPFLERLDELVGVTQQSRTYHDGNWWITRTTTDEGTSTFFVQPDLSTQPRVLLDPEDLPADIGTVREVSLSPDGRRLAYVLDNFGPAAMELRIRDVELRRDLADRIPGVRWGRPQWTADSSALIYSRLLRPGIHEPDGIDRESVIGLHVIGTEAERDPILYRVDPEDLGAGAGAALSSDSRYVIVDDTFDHEQSLAVIDLGPSEDPKPIYEVVLLTQGRQGKNQYVGCLADTVYLLTTVDAPKGRIVAVDLARPREWRTVVAESDDLLERARVIGGRLLVGHRRDVCSVVRVFSLDGRVLHQVALPALGSAYYFSGDERESTASLAFDSFLHPEVVLAHDVSSGKTTSIRSAQLAIDPLEYHTEQVFYRSADGTQVPMFVCSRRGVRESGPAPTLLTGYGANGAVMDPIFYPDWFAWVEAGGVLAIPGIRGGGEYGEAWHQAGKLGNKQNTFDDFIAAAEFLIQSGVTSPDQLAIHGSSNGGLLIGAVMTQRPDLFAAALPAVGVLDALRFHLFTAGPRWAKDMGDPTFPEQFAWLYSWSPLHRVKDGVAYPATLITTARDDDIVHPSQSYKFAARLQQAQAGANPVLLRVYSSGGHGGRTDRESRAEELADRLSFAAQFTGLRLPLVGGGR